MLRGNSKPLVFQLGKRQKCQVDEFSLCSFGIVNDAVSTRTISTGTWQQAGLSKSINKMKMLFEISISVLHFVSCQTSMK